MVKFIRHARPFSTSRKDLCECFIYTVSIGSKKRRLGVEWVISALSKSHQALGPYKIRNSPKRLLYLHRLARAGNVRFERCFRAAPRDRCLARWKSEGRRQ